MAELSEKQKENNPEKGRGRPKKDVDPSGTALLFGDNNEVNPIVADSYGDYDDLDDDDGARGAGTVGGEGADVPAYSDEALLQRLWAMGHDPDVPASAQAGALVKCSQLREKLKEKEGGGDLSAELRAFIDLVKAERLQEVVTVGE